MSTLFDAIKIARALLNDDDGLTWADHLIIPKVPQAWGEILAKFQLNGIPVVKEETAPLAVVANTTLLTIPTDMQDPIKLEEYGQNETQDQAVAMTQVDFIPNIQRDTLLRYWCWTEQQVKLLGATTQRNVLLYYIKSLIAPRRLADTLAINQSEIYLGPRLASLCLASKGQASQLLSSMAETNMSLVLRAQVKRMQTLPVRKRPFSYQARRNRFSL